MGGWVDLGDWITSRLGIESATAWSKVRRPNRCITKTPLLSSSELVDWFRMICTVHHHLSPLLNLYEVCKRGIGLIFNKYSSYLVSARIMKDIRAYMHDGCGTHVDECFVGGRDSWGLLTSATDTATQTADIEAGITTVITHQGNVWTVLASRSTPVFTLGPLLQSLTGFRTISKMPWGLPFLPVTCICSKLDRCGLISII